MQLATLQRPDRTGALLALLSEDFPDLLARLTQQASAAPDATPAPYPPLSAVTRPTVPTAQAAYYLDRAPQTLRMWAMKDGTGPVRPVRVHGILAWPVAELRRVLGVS